jgi:hypothetical protein
MESFMLEIARPWRRIYPIGILWALAGVALLLPACGRGSRKAVYPVHGYVFDTNNKPASGALVVFHPLEDDASDHDKPRAFVAEDGSFALSTYEKDDGAPEGEYAVTIEWRPKSANPFGGNKQKPDQLKGRYSDANKPKLRFKIERKRDNVLEPIQLH